LEIGKGRIVLEGTTIAILSLGSMLKQANAAAEELESRGLSTTVADARFAKPIDRELIRQLAENHDVLITIEEASVGGFGALVSKFLANEGLLDGNLMFRTMTMPDAFLEQDSTDRQIVEAGLDAEHIVANVLNALGRNQEADNVLGIASV
jgi:1-deoxy-D-xylulose-5-phosphate synthase